MTGKEIVALRDRQRVEQANFRALWQSTADLIFPRENAIDYLPQQGEDKTINLHDSTAVQDSREMASGLSGAMIPLGRAFFGLSTPDYELANWGKVSQYLHLATKIQHSEMFRSNFMLQLNETLRSIVVFGTGNLFTDADHSGLIYRDYDVAMYQIMEDSRGDVDTVILTFSLTPVQAAQEFGQENLGEKLNDALTKEDQKYKPWEFVKLVRPRNFYDPRKRDVKNMPYESTTVSVKDGYIVKQGGYHEFPFAVARWMKSSHEVYGRGQGMEALPDVRQLQQMRLDFIEEANRLTRPPLEVLESYEGIVNMSPAAINYVAEAGSIRAIDQRALGQYPVTKDMIEMQQEQIHRSFFRDIFAMLSDLKGDRRTTVEINARLGEGLRRLALPVARLEAELFNKTIMRTYMLLVRSGRIPPPPPELAGKQISVEYEGQLSLALRNQEAEGFRQLVEVAGGMAQMYPDVLDVIDAEAGIRQQARYFGVNPSVLRSEEDVDARRQAREQAMAAQQAAELASTAAAGYSKASKAPEEGSAAGKLMEAMGA